MLNLLLISLLGYSQQVTGTVTCNQGASAWTVMTPDPVDGGVKTMKAQQYGPWVVILDGGVSITNWPTSQPVTGTFYQATQPVSGSVSVSNLPATQPVSGTLTCNVGTGTQPVSGSVSVSNLPATQPVTGTFWQATQPISGSVTASGTLTCNAGTGTLAVSGPATDTQLRATPLPISGTITANVGTGTQPVSGTFWQATQPVSGTFFQATQPVSLASAPTTPVTGTFWQATQPVSGTVAVSNFPASQAVTLAAAPTTPVTGTFWQATQPTSLAVLPALTVAAASSTSPIGSVSLGTTLGKTNVMQTGTLVTTAVTADQVVKTYTVTAGKTLFLLYVSVNGRLTTFAATATNFGECSLESPAGTKLLTTMLAGSGIGDRDYLPFNEGVPIAAGTVVRLVCTPTAVTSMTWRGNFGGYEK